MARPPKIYWRSPLESSRKPDPPESMPYPMVRGLVRALLGHLWSDNRRKPNEVGVEQDKLEQALLLYAELATRNGKSLSEGDLLKKIERDVPKIFASCLGHTPRLFTFQSDFILGVLRKISPQYGSLKTCGKRVAWIKSNLHDCLALLKQFQPCSQCRMETALPDDEILEWWAFSTGLGQLRLFLLGHFHDHMSPDTVKRLLASPTTSGAN